MARTPPRRGAAAPAAKAPAASVHGIHAGLERQRREQEKADARAEASKLTQGAPFRFYIKEGKSTQFIVVDDEPTFFRSEHALQNPKTKRFDMYVPCIDEVANCPACDVDTKQPYFGMYLTIIDLTAYEDKDGNQVEWSKKLLVVKLAQQKKFVRVWEQHKTLRGAVFDVSRTGKMSSNIGSDIDFVEFAPEDELAGYVTDYEDKDGKIIDVYGDEPFDYEEIFPDLTEEQIAQVCGIKHAESDAQSHRSSRRASREAPADDAPPPRRGDRSSRAHVEEEPASRPARAAGRRSAAPQAAEEPVSTRPARRSQAAAEPEAAAPARRRSAPAQEAEAPAPRRAAGRRQAEAQEDPPQRSAARRRAPAEDNPLPDEPVATAAADRRAQLRRTR